MTSFFKKALNAFVEFDDETQTDNSTARSLNQPTTQSPPPPAFSASSSGESTFSARSATNSVNALQQSEIEKFERYFDKLIEDAILPGPDYFEFHKMMDTLSVHILDEKSRIAATFATLNIQGLTKQKLVESAEIYKSIIQKDRADFDAALHAKMNAEVSQRKNGIEEMEKKIIQNTELVKKLSQENIEAQQRIDNLRSEIGIEQAKLQKNNSGYQIASQAIIQQISTDIQKIQTVL